jgi:hypothetical protein
MTPRKVSAKNNKDKDSKPLSPGVGEGRGERGFGGE